ncbi:MAG: protein translocase subunit SecF [Candidatus Eisenbacteria bacterium]|uniref:Protein-export membrane protein SecF n=1 Tax=Eiseniibacteriota bacterium TaxID=2212470 RepID=A0A538T2M6_UNCEI|nr:MAG: protein translocase subunit SecF [Candidatus Eisenbacteria bacterium]
MLQILHGVNVNWMARRHIAFMVSGAFVLVSIISLIVHGGPRYGVDFTGGTLLELQITPPVSVDAVRTSVDHAGFTGSEIQKLDRPGQVLIRVESRAGRGSPSTAVPSALRQAHPGTKVDVIRVESVGPRVGNELRGAAIKAIFVALGLILIYVGIRYDWRYSLGAVVALFHDVFITLGAISITNKEVTLTVVAALLTIAGYSINDTIVVFDRIRERSKTLRREPPEKVMNIAINETLSRTIITSFTVFLTVVSLYTLGGEVIHDFSFAMLVGVVFGTYSSVYVASGLALEVQLSLERAGRGKK